MEKKQNVPALRFRGFSSEWNDFTLEKCTNRFDNLRVPISASQRIAGSTPYYGANGIQDYVHGYTHKGEYILIAEDGANDVNNYPIHYVNGEVWVNNHAHVLQGKDGIANTKFLKYALSKMDFRSHLVGGSRAKLNANIMMAMEVKLPLNASEQKLLGEFLDDVDGEILLRQHKIQKLQQFRQAMLTKLFPWEGAAEPELRFRGFSGKWEQRKLLENFQKIIDFRGRTPKKLGMDWSKEGYLALSALNVKDGYIDFKQECHYGSRELYDKWMTGNELHKGQVIFTTEAPMGNVAQIPDNKKYILSQRTIAFEVKPDLINEDFLAILLRTPQMFQKLSALSSGGTAKGISQRSMEAVDAFFPIDILEQKKIGDFFKDLDFIISLQQKKLEQMQRLKAALLEKMFV